MNINPATALKGINLLVDEAKRLGISSKDVIAMIERGFSK